MVYLASFDTPDRCSSSRGLFGWVARQNPLITLFCFGDVSASTLSSLSPQSIDLSCRAYLSRQIHVEHRAVRSGDLFRWNSSTSLSIIAAVVCFHAVPPCEFLGR